ncbi:unnamed protein product [Moneuplotes crassus]|uniref:Uncharacterized protein n=1 Tax=Euplotes crassus TaxID=5936 RepID=A0AAD1XLC6_EUPCR|nr:unnamed protein product [Moneuplotes crassus]
MVELGKWKGRPREDSGHKSSGLCHCILSKLYWCTICAIGLLLDLMFRRDTLVSDWARF